MEEQMEIVPVRDPDRVIPSPRKTEPDTLSTRLWGVDWTRHFPILSKNGAVECRHVPFEKIEHYLLNPTDADYQEKKKFYGFCADAFGFYDLTQNDKLIGAGIANPSDPTTYYIRAAHIFEQYRSNGLFTEWVRTLTDAMRACASLQRIEVEINTQEPRMPIIYARLGYRITGTTFNDRWGGIIRMTAHLKPQFLDSFTEKFCPPTAPKAQITQGGVS